MNTSHYRLPLFLVMLAIALAFTACGSKKPLQVMVKLEKAEKADGGQYRYTFTVENKDKAELGAKADLAVTVLKSDGSKANTFIEHTTEAVAPGAQAKVDILMDVAPESYGGATYTLSNNDVEVSGVVTGTP